MRDEELLCLLKSDPEAGMKALISQYSGIVWSVVKERLSMQRFTAADIEDCAADTFSEFFLALERYDPDKCSIKTWLCILARNNAFDMLRKIRRKNGTVSLDEAMLDSLQEDFSIEGDFEKREDRAVLIDAIKKLGSPDKEIIVMKYYLGLSSREISRELGLSVSNVNTRTHRAVRKLRDRIEGNE